MNRRHACHAFFFAAGLAVLRLQWHIMFDFDRSGIPGYLSETLLLVPLLALPACACTIFFRDPILFLLAFATMLLGLLHVADLAVPLRLGTVDIMNGAARCYGLMTVVAWPLAALTSRWRVQWPILASLAILLAPLCFAWSWQRQSVVWRIQSPSRQDMALFEAARRGDTAAIGKLLDEGAHLAAADEGGWQPLMYAVSGGSAAAVRVLLQRGADPDAREDYSGSRCDSPGCNNRMLVTGQTALMLAAERGDAQVATVLLGAGARPGARDAQGRTAADVSTSAQMRRLVAPGGIPKH